MAAITLQQIQEDPDRKDIFGILNEYIQPESTTSAGQATFAFVESVKVADEKFFWAFWDDIFNVAEQIPHDNAAQDKLAAFIRELRLGPETGEKVWDARVWIDLPILSAAIREHLDQVDVGDARISFHAFLARLFHAGVTPATETTAIWILRDALEKEVKPADDESAFDNDLAIAAMYIEYAGATLVRKLALNPNPVLNNDFRRLLRGGELWEGSGLTVDRWTFWGKRFEELADTATSEETKELALHAAQLIVAWFETQLSK
ncbi:hypothetical protein E0Z10_g9911 [Xylaria hypoxylon]|uniref:Uncharacterized protein n=1 Tax=Xylaria hypoxylon TaxID=37992 RepID=A0A4Z0YJJ5_9PEZI|nr:hypothetical protein E0Z10_g9911 [Xylaria hypoxylon]